VPSASTSDSDAVWGEWLSLYLEHCRQSLEGEQLAELAAALEAGTRDRGRLALLVGERTAAEGRWLVDFLGTIEHASIREGLVADAVARLRAMSRRS
jgi:hypothetical protein